jgi:two-component system cell cycle sensor histidine kinase/response regulator CckA
MVGPTCCDSWRARELRPGIEQSFVFMSGGAFTPSRAQFLATVANPRLDKPFTAAQLRGALDRLLAGRRTP